MKTRSILILSLLFFSTSVWAQGTSLTVKQKSKTAYKINITLCDSLGNSQLNADEFIASDFIHFVLNPTSESERPYFKESDLNSMIGSITFVQGQNIPQAKPPKPFLTEKRITSVVLTYRKTDIKIWAPFNFISAVGESAVLHFPEIFYNDFKWFNIKNQEISRYESEKKYARMLEMVKEVLAKKESSEYFSHMSFYPDFVGKWPLTAINGQLSNLREPFESANQRLLDDFQFKEIENMSIVIRQVNELSQQASYYTQAAYPKSEEAATLISQTIREFTETLRESRRQFLEKKLGILTSGTFSKYQFSLFTDLIYKKILRSTGFSSAKGLFSLSKTLITSEVTTLTSMGWEQDFADLMYALEADQLENGGKYIFNPAIIENLHQQVGNQPKPYYEIFVAANSATIGNDNFISFIESAIKTVPTFGDLQQLETMMMCYPSKEEEFSDQALNNLNTGLAKMTEGKWRESKNSFEYAIRQESMFAPAWFYLALCEYNLDEIFSAQSRIEKALSLAPEYLSPKLFLFELYNSQMEFDKILKMSSEILKSQSIYLVHLWKATAHFQLKQYKEALEEINNNCLTLNPNQEDNYFLQGDVYAAMKKYDLAKDSYLKTQVINPFDTSRFNAKMKLLP